MKRNIDKKTTASKQQKKEKNTLIDNNIYYLTLFFLLFLSVPERNLLGQFCSTCTDQNQYGNGSWIGYVYNHNGYGNPINSPFATYRGCFTENETFDSDWGAGRPPCLYYNDNFAIRYRMRKYFPCGRYTFTIGGDDGVRLSFDGGASFPVGIWNDHAYETTTHTVDLNGTYDLVLEYYESAGEARVSFNYTVTYATLPVAEAGPDQSISCGDNAVLAGNYSPGYGANISWSGGPFVSGQNTLTPTVNPTTTTTYTMTATHEFGCSSSDNLTVIVDPPSGDPNVFGNNVWRVYGYNGNDVNISNNVYRGYYIQPNLGGNNFGVNIQNYWDVNLSPSSAGTTKSNGNLWNGCDVDVDYHTYVHKRKGFPCGNYTFNMINWDDKVRVIIDGVTVWSCDTWSGNDTNPCHLTSSFTRPLDADSEVAIQLVENSGASRLNVSITPIVPSALTGAGTSTKTCPVEGKEWVNFLDENNELIASINPHGDNLGNVTMTSYVGTPNFMKECSIPENTFYHTTYMGRRWVMTSDAYPNGEDFSNNVSVRLPFYTNELNDLNTYAQTITAENPFDGGITDLPASRTNMILTKITGTTSDGVANQADCSSTIRGIASSNSGINVQSIPNTEYIDFEIEQFSEFFLHKSFENTPLPVELTDFSAACNEYSKEVSINWSTSSEHNSEHFIIEKSRDGQIWNFVTEKQAAGNSTTHISYTSTDTQPWSGIAYYRLKQIDFNSKEEIFGPISVSCKTIENDVTVYPNPNNGSFTVEITGNKILSGVQLILTDVAGKIIHSQNVDISNGTNQFLLNNINLRKGIYFIDLKEVNDQLKPTKVIVQ